MHILVVADGRSPTTRRWIQGLLALKQQVTLISTYPCAEVPGTEHTHILPVAFGGFSGSQVGTGQPGTGGRTAARRLVTALSARPDLVKLVFIDAVEFHGKHLALAYPAVAPGMQKFADRLRRAPAVQRPITDDGLLRAFFGLFYTFHMTEMLLGKPAVESEAQAAAIQELAEIYLHGILA